MHPMIAITNRLKKRSSELLFCRRSSVDLAVCNHRSQADAARPMGTAGLTVSDAFAFIVVVPTRSQPRPYRNLVPTSVPSANRKKGWSVRKEDAKI